jgi:hypothetical protein
MLHFARNTSSPTSKIFSDTSWCVEVTHGGCSCGLYTEPPAPGKLEADLHRQRQRLLLKGWSSTKIERSLKAKSESSARPGRNHEAAEAFSSLVAALVGKIGYVDVFAHAYTGNQYEESVGTPERGSVSLDQFLEAGFPSDTVVSVHGAAG